ncbi:MAG: ribosome maturation factor RimM [Acutalibacteraceae bacterium]
MALKEFLEAGKIVGTHGVRGEMRIDPWSDSPDFLKGFKTLYLDSTGETALKIEASRAHKNILLAKAKDINSIEEAEKYRGHTVYIKRSDAKLPEGSYFMQDIIGCAAYDADSGEKLGEISEVSRTGANDVWHVKRNKREYLVPVIDEVLDRVDINAGRVSLRPLKGIFDDED